ncbi:unnamed protein product [Mucor hiemalis]
MKRFKAKQNSVFQGTQTKPPVEKIALKRKREEDIGEASTETKRQRTAPSAKELDRYFFKSMENRIRFSIRAAVQKRGENLDDELKALKIKLSTAKVLPRGIITDAANLAKSEYNDNLDIAVKRMRHFITNRVGKKNEVEWQELVIKLFDTFKDEETTAHQPVEHNSDGDDNNEASDEISATETEESYRTCTSSFEKLLRNDLQTDVRSIILNRLNDAVFQTTDYVFHFSSLVQLMIICLKDSQFYINQGSISTRKVNGFNMTTIIPNQFHTDSSATTIEPLAIDVSNSPAFDADFNSLFQDQHLTFIHTEYFGIRGVSEQTMRAHPVQSSLLRLLESEEIKKDTFAEVNAPSTLKQIALQSYITNFKNMWSDKIMINKLLDKVLIVLLRLHLAPTRESRRREMMNSHLEKDKEEKRPTKNYSRNILRLEMKKLKRYEKKLSNASTNIEKERWLVVTEASRNRIMQLKEKLKKPRQSKGSSPLLGKLKGKFNEADNDISGRRIGQLKSAVKHLLFSKDSATKQDVEDEIYNVTHKEIDMFFDYEHHQKILACKSKISYSCLSTSILYICK